MPTLNNGTFTYEIGAVDLARGLRPSKRSPRNTKFLTKCEGAVGLDNVLQVIDDLDVSRIDTAVITDGFPYPQIFVYTNVIIVCGAEDIYEYITGALVFQLNVAAGIAWSAVDFYDYIYMSNGKVAVRRRATDGLWEIAADLPIASGIVNFNGQVMIGAPNVEWT